MSTLTERWSIATHRRADGFHWWVLGEGLTPLAGERDPGHRSVSVFAPTTAAENHRPARIRPMRRDASRRQHNLPGGAHNGNAGLTPTLPLTRGSTANPPAATPTTNGTGRTSRQEMSAAGARQGEA